MEETIEQAFVTGIANFSSNRGGARRSWLGCRGALCSPRHTSTASGKPPCGKTLVVELMGLEPTTPCLAKQPTPNGVLSSQNAGHA